MNEPPKICPHCGEEHRWSFEGHRSLMSTPRLLKGAWVKRGKQMCVIEWSKEEVEAYNAAREAAATCLTVRDGEKS